MATKTGPKNAACHEGCQCSCCQSQCPYCTLTSLIAQLKSHGVSADVAAKVACDFVMSRCQSARE